MIDWVHDDCKDWADYIRRTPRAWPSKSTEWRIWMEQGADGGDAGSSGPEWNWPENVMEVHRAYRQMPENLRNVMYECYVRKGSPEAKAKRLNVSRANMYSLRSNCHYFIAGLIVQKDSRIRQMS